MRALGIAATGMMAQQTNVDVISNNIANANTTGFKSSRAAFQDLIYDSQTREGAITAEEGTVRPTGVDVGLGVRGLAQGELVAHYSIFRVFRLLSPLQGFSAEGHGYLLLVSAVRRCGVFFALQLFCSAVLFHEGGSTALFALAAIRYIF